MSKLSLQIIASTLIGLVRSVLGGGGGRRERDEWDD